jgi:ArsR family transcriptional regulator
LPSAELIKESETHFDYHRNVDTKTATRALGALAQPRRLQLFRRLVAAGPAGSTPQELLRAAKVANATLSFHLKQLVEAKLITQERQGRHRIYRASFGEIGALLAYLAEDCCGGQPCEVDINTKARR